MIILIQASGKFLRKIDFDKFKEYAPIILRIGLSIVFLWFGISQLINPESFIGYVPEFLYDHPNDMNHEHPLQLAHNLPLTSHMIIMGNGAFETIFGLLLLLGMFTRISALLLAIHLLIITIGLGYNDIAVRDFGLVIATISIFLNGEDKFLLDKKMKRKLIRNSLLKFILV